MESHHPKRMEAEVVFLDCGVRFSFDWNSE